MTAVVLAARLLLVVVFVVSAVAKLRDRPGSRQAVADFGVPAGAVGVVAGALPFLELGCAALLVGADPAASLGAVASLALLAAFTVAIVMNLRRGNRVDCHCFGQFGGGSIGWPTVGRNALLMVLAAICLVGAGGRGSVPTVIADYDLREIALAAAGLLLLAALTLLAIAFHTLLRKYGDVLIRLEALEMSGGRGTPRPAPDFALPDLDGEVVALVDVLKHQRPVLLVFVSPTCSRCAELAPELESWQADVEHAVSVVVVSDGTGDANREKFGADSPLRLLLQTGRETAKAYQVAGTPAAFLLGVDGRFAAPAAYGVPAVRAMHADVLRTMTGVDTPVAPPVHRIGRRPAAAGDPLPEVDVTTEDGESVPLVQVTGDEAILLFWRTTCGFCASILDRVVALESQTHIVIVTETEISELRSSGLRSVVASDPVGDLGGNLRIPGTPSAVRVRDGLLASGVVVGGPDVLALLTESASAESVAH